MSNEITHQTMTPEKRRMLYNQAVKQANLVSILLSSVDFDVNRDTLYSSENNVPYFNGKVDSVYFDESEGSCMMRIVWEVRVKSGKKSPVKCVAKYDILYNGFSNESQIILPIFADGVAKSATYSYFRSLFASLDWAAELRMPPLPVFKNFPRV